MIPPLPSSPLKSVYYDEEEDRRMAKLDSDESHVICFSIISQKLEC